MMNEQEFISLYENQKPALKEWGEFIKKSMLDFFKDKGYDLECFLKVPVKVRLKDNTSIISKAFYRGKKYNNPINDITDKVGLRFVVLIPEEIHIISNIIEKAELWNFSKDRDFDKERDENPTIFTYQSVHYILRNKCEFVRNDIIIPNDIPCEVQIRTLLQHAYSELTHDTVYKPKHAAEPYVQRLVARSMAMIETTDCIFEEVNTMVNKKNDYFSKNLLPIINSKFQELNKSQYDEGITDILIDSYSKELDKINKDDLLKFISNYNEVMDNSIKLRYDDSLLYRQPIILVIYFLAKNNPIITKYEWPFTEDLLRPIYISLGIRFDQY